jgi:hypothetical protein
MAAISYVCQGAVLGTLESCAATPMGATAPYRSGISIWDGVGQWNASPRAFNILIVGTWKCQPMATIGPNLFVLVILIVGDALAIAD